jgi:two-component system NtrC family sensor kinase
MTSLAGVLRDVTARLTAPSTGPDVLDDALAVLRDGLGADECSVWQWDGSAWCRDSRAGISTLDAAAVAAADRPGDDPRNGVTLLRLRYAARELGALTVVRAAPLDEEERLVMEAAAGILAIARDAEERAHRAAADVAASVRATEEQHRLTRCIVDSLPLGLHVVDREYRVQAWNRKRETGLQGVLREEALGRTIFEILRRQPADLLRDEFDEVFETGRMLQMETQSTASGEARIYRVSKIPMRVDGGAVTHVITVGEDITDSRRAQERVAEAQRLAALGQLAAGVMHEINNPLATIGACAESLGLQLHEAALPPALDEAIAEYAQIIEHEVYRCKRIVDGLLDFSRPGTQSRAPVHVNEAVEQTLFLLKHHSRFKRMRVDTVLEPLDGVVVNGNREQLIQVLMALLLNAADAMEPGGEVRVSTAREAPPATGVTIAVEDRGQGIPATVLGRLFEPFYTTKSPGRGTGLGLSICYGIVSDHGGRIEVESEVGAGSTFRVHLPVAGA